jgi:hypothetical protein
VILAERALEQALHCILGKTREDMTPDEENRPDQPNSVRLAVMTAWHSGAAHDGKMSRAAAAVVGADGPRAAVPRLPSVVEFCGNELKICGNTNCLCPLHCVKRWHDLAQRIARVLDYGFFSSTDETVPVCALCPLGLVGTAGRYQRKSKAYTLIKKGFCLSLCQLCHSV